MKAVDFAEKLKEALRDLQDDLRERFHKGERSLLTKDFVELRDGIAIKFPLIIETIDNTLKQKTKRYVLEGFVRSYYSPREEGSAHRTYRGMLHHLKKDKKLKTGEFLYRILADKVPEGNAVRIIVEDTGQQAEKADTRWVLLRPHHYGPETEAEDDEIVS